MKEYGAKGTSSLKELVQSLETPRVLMDYGSACGC